MALKSEKFKKAIAIIMGKKEPVQQTPPTKTLKQRAKERMQELGVDREKFYKFGKPQGAYIIKLTPSSNARFTGSQTPFDEEQQIQYMSDSKNWLLVHTTNYMPENQSIQTKAMAENWSIPRATVHFTLNHIVQSHMGGNWDDKPVVILTPFNDTVQKNNLPVGFALVDTYFSPDADAGLKLPNTARVVHPGKVPDGHLLKIKQNETIYKADNYTDSEIEEILSLITPKERQIYDNLSQGILDDDELYELFKSDYSGKIKKSYDKAKDKQKFLAGIMEDTKYKILIHFVRHLATHLTIERMGYEEISAHGGDMTGLARQVADTAYNMGIQNAVSFNKGHDNSVYDGIENVYSAFDSLKEHISETQTYKDLQKTLQTIADTWSTYAKAVKIITDSVIEKHPVQATKIYEIYTETFQRYYENKKIGDIDKNLDTTIKRHCEYQAKEFDKMILKLKEIPGFLKIAEQIYMNHHYKYGMSHER